MRVATVTLLLLVTASYATSQPRTSPKRLKRSISLKKDTETTNQLGKHLVEETNLAQLNQLTQDVELTKLVRRKRWSEEVISIVATLLELWDLVDTKIANNELNFDKFANFSLDLSFLNRKQAQITSGILGISKQLTRMEANLAHSVDYTIDSILTAVPKLLRTELRLHELKSVVNQINLQDRELQRYLKNQSAIERHTLEDWALAVSSHQRDSIRNLMGRLHVDVSPTNGEISVFQLIRQGVGGHRGYNTTTDSWPI